MKKIMISVVCLLAVGTLLGCQKQASTTDNHYSTSKRQSSSQKQTTVNPKVTLTEATQVYQNHYDTAKITSITLKPVLNRYYYEIEGVDDQNEYELRIDAQTKQVSQERTEKLDSDEQNGVEQTADQLDLNQLISLKEATKIAEQAVKSSHAQSWELSKDDDQAIWEVKVAKQQQLTEVSIDAQTSEVLETDTDD